MRGREGGEAFETFDFPSCGGVQQSRVEGLEQCESELRERHGEEMRWRAEMDSLQDRLKKKSAKLAAVVGPVLPFSVPV